MPLIVKIENGKPTGYKYIHALDIAGVIDRNPDWSLCPVDYVSPLVGGNHPVSARAYVMRKLSGLSWQVILDTDRTLARDRCLIRYGSDRGNFTLSQGVGIISEIFPHWSKLVRSEVKSVIEQHCIGQRQKKTLSTSELIQKALASKK
jgi:hypothetical protein